VIQACGRKDEGGVNYNNMSRNKWRVWAVIASKKDIPFLLHSEAERPNQQGGGAETPPRPLSSERWIPISIPHSHLRLYRPFPARKKCQVQNEGEEDWGGEPSFSPSEPPTTASPPQQEVLALPNTAPAMPLKGSKWSEYAAVVSSRVRRQKPRRTRNRFLCRSLAGTRVRGRARPA
jgi:hypothetical protein